MRGAMVPGWYTAAGAGRSHRLVISGRSREKESSPRYAGRSRRRRSNEAMSHLLEQERGEVTRRWLLFYQPQDQEK